MPRSPFPDGWKGEKGLYCVGFTRRGLLGTSHDALNIAKDISQQWKKEVNQTYFHWSALTLTQSTKRMVAGSLCTLPNFAEGQPCDDDVQILIGFLNIEMEKVWDHERVWIRLMTIAVGSLNEMHAGKQSQKKKKKVGFIRAAKYLWCRNELNLLQEMHAGCRESKWHQTNCYDFVAGFLNLSMHAAWLDSAAMVKCEERRGSLGI